MEQRNYPCIALYSKSVMCRALLEQGITYDEAILLVFMTNEDDFFVIESQEIYTETDDFEMAFQASYECLLDRGTNNARAAKLPFYDEIQMISR